MIRLDFINDLGFRLLITLVYSTFEIGKLIIIFSVESCFDVKNAKKKNTIKRICFDYTYTREKIVVGFMTKESWNYKPYRFMIS